MNCQVSNMNLDRLKLDKKGRGQIVKNKKKNSKKIKAACSQQLVIGGLCCFSSKLAKNSVLFLEFKNSFATIFR